MALYRLGASLSLVLAFVAGVAGCNNQSPEGRTPASPSVEVTPDMKAFADVDRRATLALKQTLLTRFPQNTASDIVEAGLVTDGFECAPYPTEPTQRACLLAVRDGACEINTIVRTTPYAPEKAQVIKICEVSKANPTP